MQFVLIGIFALATVYNLFRYINILVMAKIKNTEIISLAAIIAIIILLFYKYLDPNIYNYLLATIFILYSISGIIANGYNKKGVFAHGHITFLSKMTKWKDITEINLEYNADNFVDVIFVTKTRVIRHRYDESSEAAFLKIKKDLKI